jgi:hypothetical protein
MSIKFLSFKVNLLFSTRDELLNTLDLNVVSAKESQELRAKTQSIFQQPFVYKGIIVGLFKLHVSVSIYIFTGLVSKLLD